jgi:hypothetical protein
VLAFLLFRAAARERPVLEPILSQFDRIVIPFPGTTPADDQAAPFTSA